MKLTTMFRRGSGSLLTQRIRCDGQTVALAQQSGANSVNNVRARPKRNVASRAAHTMAFVLAAGMIGCAENPVAPSTTAETYEMDGIVEQPRAAVFLLAPLVWEAIASALTVWSAKEFIDDCAPGITTDLYSSTVSETTVEKCLVGGALALTGESVAKKLIVSGDVSKLKGAAKKAFGSTVSSKTINSIFRKASRPAIKDVKRELTSKFYESLVKKAKEEIWKFHP